MVLVQKYGGSSVADVAKIGQVADKVVAAKRAGHDVVVVVSAMGKTTDQLLALAKSVAPAHEPPRRELDMLLSTGERVSMALLSIAIQSRGFDAISFTGSQSGIITNDRHFDARIIEVRPHRIEDELSRGKIVIIAGYQGMSYKREITTLGRGGSDTTAVALAAALQADRCEIYSDVDGVYAADPRVVEQPEHLPTIDLATLQEMAEAGAKVLCAQAVEWARRQKIAIYARRTSDPSGVDSSPPARQTIASEDAVAHVRAVVGMDNVVRVRTRATLDRAGEWLAHLPTMDLVADDAGVTCAIGLTNVPDWGKHRDALAAHTELNEGLSMVSVVGSELRGPSLATFARVLAEVGASPVRVVAMPLRLSALIAKAMLVDAQRALYAAFVR